MAKAARTTTRTSKVIPDVSILPAEPPVREYPYPISLDYVKGWTVERGIAEIIANAIDADPHGYVVRYADGVLEISDGASDGIGAEGMLLGFSDKRADQIGQFGEGLKLGTLVLARAEDIGDVFIETVGYAFSPVVVEHSGMGGLAIPTRTGADVKALAWRIWPSDRPRGTRVRIVCSQAVAESAIGRFRHLTEPGYRPVPEPGVVITDGQSGRVFIGGVFVSRRPDLLFSYDLGLASSKALQNRDRTVIDGHVLSQRIRTILLSCDDRAVIEQLVDAALGGEVAPSENIFTSVQRADQRRLFHDIGKARFGDRPVFFRDGYSSDEAALALEDQGYKPVAAPRLDTHAAGHLMGLLGVPRASDLHKDHETRIPARRESEWVTDRALTADEKAVLAKGVMFIRAAFGAHAIDKVKVYTATSIASGQCSDWLGFYTPGTGDIAVRRDQLASLSVLLRVLLHESAHRIAHRFHAQVGLAWPDYSDRSRGFERALGEMSAILIERLAAADLLKEPEVVRVEKLRPAPPQTGPGHVAVWDGRRWETMPAAAAAQRDLVADALAGWAAERGIPFARCQTAYAREAYVEPWLVRKALRGVNPGLWQRTADVVKPLRLSPGVAWWAFVGSRYLATRRASTRRRSWRFDCPDQVEAACADLAALGGEYATIATDLAALAAGEGHLDVLRPGWDAMLLRLVALDRERLGIGSREIATKAA